jgi:hypothetical protein
VNLHLGALLLLSVVPGSPQEKKLQPPDAAGEKKAERDIRDVFKDEYSKKTPPDRVALTKLLLDQGIQTKDDPAARYVLLREAKEVASAAGDLKSALRAVDEMAASFVIDAPSMRGGVFAAAAKAARTPEEFQSIADGFLSVTDEAIAAEEYEAAERWALEALSMAKKSKTPPLVIKAEGKGREVSERKVSYEILRKARETLASNPNDPEANLAAGRYECFQRNNWRAGLPLLGKGSDPGLKDMAAKDLAQPGEVEAQVALGDGWWDLGERQAGPSGDLVRQRAAFWYEQVAPRTTGLTRTKIESRCREAHAALAIDLLRLIDPKKDTVSGEWVFEGTALVCVKLIEAERLQIPYIPPEEYVLTVVAERLSGVEAINVGLSSGDVQFHMVIDGWAKDGYFSGLSLVDKKFARENETTRAGQLLVNYRPSTIECSVRKSGLKMTVDGKVIFEWAGDIHRLSNFPMLKTPNPKALYISGWATKYRFSKICLTPITGTGEKLR